MNQLTNNTKFLLQADKKEIGEAVKETLNDIQEGNLSILDLECQLKVMEEFIKKLTSDKVYKETLLEEAQKNGKAFDYKNAGFQIKEVGVKYDYSKCGHGLLNTLMDQVAYYEGQIKKFQEYLKTLPAEGVKVLDEGTGEMETHYPPTKRSTTSVSVTLK